ncbi:hypothetical protein PP175_29135 (plasmid) [Aneurinibacillus sp. Ricciae_BoGa-3]|uniref:hypothetical protein n=1 Tax=Aneurinibacillus sp. Ricciae_BoGa-3 TaxID=3022697 RepID=UPI0023400041|nr:hypothetical protein [Aneurinibacillus sp. Ricciae_BoGa-3]WCK57257.1 hypothetical protein PP175_29135 [Aneurinibacillus sp. Ricciae_BoGa-3]
MKATVNYQGCDELHNQVEKIFKHREKEITWMENGLRILVPGLPYSFQISCYEEIGWNVFLTSHTDSFEDDEETDRFYSQLEDAIEEVNTQYFDFGDHEREIIAQRFFDLKFLTEDKLQKVEGIDAIKDTGRYVLKVAFKEPQQNEKSVLELGYSNVFERWYMDVPETPVFQHDGLKQELTQLDSLITSYNQA